jgi:hypothetical protein
VWRRGAFRFELESCGDDLPELGLHLGWLWADAAATG